MPGSPNIWSRTWSHNCDTSSCDTPPKSILDPKFWDPLFGAQIPYISPSFRTGVEYYSERKTKDQKAAPNNVEGASYVGHVHLCWVSQRSGETSYNWAQAYCVPCLSKFCLVTWKSHPQWKSCCYDLQGKISQLPSFFSWFFSSKHQNSSLLISTWLFSSSYQEGSWQYSQQRTMT